MARRAGRRPGKPGTREVILEAARAAFAQKGFDGTPIRRVARDAGVDPSLVHHYFGTKQQLFLAAIEAPVDPSRIIPGVVDGGPHGIGERLVRAVLGVWDDPVAGPRVAAILRSAVQHEPSAQLLREFFSTQIMRPVLSALEPPPDQSQLRATLAASQLMGLALTRYVLRLEPLASTPTEKVVAAVGPTIQRYFTGPV
jgi:AcrR family transcriptional regulator